MTASQLLFSLEGRIPRSTYWLKFILPYLVIYLVLLLLDHALGTVGRDPSVGILSGIFSLVALYPYIAVAVKRCHDRGRSGWFLLVLLIPLVNIWPAVELGFLRGTVGQNEHGPDPLS